MSKVFFFPPPPSVAAPRPDSRCSGSPAVLRWSSASPDWKMQGAFLAGEDSPGLRAAIFLVRGALARHTF